LRGKSDTHTDTCLKNFHPSVNPSVETKPEEEEEEERGGGEDEDDDNIVIALW